MCVQHKACIYVVYVSAPLPPNYSEEKNLLKKLLLLKTILKMLTKLKQQLQISNNISLILNLILAWLANIWCLFLILSKVENNPLGLTLIFKHLYLHKSGSNRCCLVW